jgi:hypothetical protein
MTLTRTALILTIVTLICFLRSNAVRESSLFDKSLPEVLETTRLLYGNEGSAFSTLIQTICLATGKLSQMSRWLAVFRPNKESSLTQTICHIHSQSPPETGVPVGDLSEFSALLRRLKRYSPKRLLMRFGVHSHRSRLVLQHASPLSGSPPPAR